MNRKNLLRNQLQGNNEQDIEDNEKEWIKRSKIGKGQESLDA